MAKIRRTLQGSPDFIIRLKKLQGKIKATNGIEPSLTDLTDKIVKCPAFEELEKQILNNNNDLIKIKFDMKIK
jgi:hypothetical protein